MPVTDGFFAHGGFIDGIEGDSHFDEFLAIGHCTGATPSVLVSLLLNAFISLSQSCDTWVIFTDPFCVRSLAS